MSAVLFSSVMMLINKQCVHHSCLSIRRSINITLPRFSLQLHNNIGGHWRTLEDTLIMKQVAFNFTVISENTGRHLNNEVAFNFTIISESIGGETEAHTKGI